MAAGGADGSGEGGGFIRRRALALSLAALAVLSLVFLAVPGIDIAVSRWAGGADGFAARHDLALQAVRAAGLAATRLAVVALVLLGIAKLVGHRLGRLVGTMDYLFLATTLAVGPGLLVNRLLKEFWGRPRPLQTDIFGGDWPFMPAWVPGGACPGDCSFVSNEAASSLWLVSLAFVVPARERLPVAAMTLAWALVMSVNRIAFGAHYLSDMLIAWAITAAVLAAGWRIFLDGPAAARSAVLDDKLAWLRRRIVSSFRRTRRP